MEKNEDVPGVSSEQKSEELETIKKRLIYRGEEIVAGMKKAKEEAKLMNDEELENAVVQTEAASIKEEHCDASVNLYTRGLELRNEYIRRKHPELSEIEIALSARTLWENRKK